MEHLLTPEILLSTLLSATYLYSNKRIHMILFLCVFHRLGKAREIHPITGSGVQSKPKDMPYREKFDLPGFGGLYWRIRKERLYQAGSHRTYISIGSYYF